MHVDEQDEVASAAHQQKRRNLDALVFSWLFVCGYIHGGLTYL
jgi:hypothetical protein